MPGDDTLLEESAIATVGNPDDTCKPAPELLEPGTQVGRYLVHALLGQGGMGVVYSAYDPELDRKIALKLLRPGVGGSASTLGRTRLLREAQSMAKLSDSNVITVHDLGTFEDRVFVAMELVDGQTLTQWLAQRRRSWRDVVGVFLHAGRGLHAAHAANLVHRDFKPDNVLIGRDGRVLVMDFGLARPVDEESEHKLDEAIVAASGIETTSERLDSLTQAGAILGTPAYMSPEQHIGLPPDARADQFSFCVSLWEGLFGERPFPGNDIASLAYSVVHGSIRAPTPGRDVPGRVVRIIRRGLCVGPEDRWASMGELLHALEQQTRRHRGRWIAAGGVGIAAVVAAALQGQQQPDRCTGADSRLTEIWNDARSAQVQTALIDSGVPYAGDTWPRVVDGIGAYADRWARTHREVCAAGHDDTILDRGMLCLGARKSELGALIQVLSVADEKVAERAVQAVDRLPDLEECADVDALRAADQPPAELAEPLARLETSLAESRALDAAGRYADSKAVAMNVASQAAALGYAPMAARADYMAGQALARTAEYAKAEEALSRAYFVAAEARLDALAAKAASELCFMKGHRQASFGEALTWARHAEAALSRVDSPDGIEADLLDNYSAVLRSQGLNEMAAELSRRALTLREASKGAESAEVATSLNNLGNSLTSLSDNQGALAHYERALAIRERILGAEHPHVASALTNLGATLDRLGREPEALEHFERALHIWEPSLGLDHPNMASLLNNIGAALDDRGEDARARAYFERALTTLERSVGRNHPRVAILMGNLGSKVVAAGEHELAAAYAEHALSIASSVLGSDHVDTVNHRMQIALVETERGNYRAARKQYRRALSIVTSAFGVDHSSAARILTQLGYVELRANRPRLARRYLARAIANDEGREPAQRAQARFWLAIALWELGEQPRSIELAERARELAVSRPTLADEIDVWIETNAATLEP